MTESADRFSTAVAGAVRAEMSRYQRSITETALAIGVTRQQLSLLLNNRRSFDTTQLAAIADFLAIPVERFFESAALSVEAVAS